jgi:hypothetical protein
VAGEPVTQTITREAAKRLEEEAALAVFLELNESPHEEPQRGRPGVEPDFLVAFTGEGRVGIEVTNDVEQERRWVEESRQEVVDLARQQYESGNATRLEVSFHFAHEQVEADRRGQAKVIAEIVEQMVLPKRGIAQVGYDVLYARGLPNLNRITVLRGPAFSRNYWSVLDARYVRVVTPVEINATIAKKEARHSAFLDSGRAWLVIYSVMGSLSDIADIGEEAQHAVYMTRFSKVFVLNVPRRALIEFQVAEHQHI